MVGAGGGGSGVILFLGVLCGISFFFCSEIVIRLLNLIVFFCPPEEACLRRIRGSG